MKAPCDGCGKVRPIHVSDDHSGFCFLCTSEWKRGRMWSYKLKRYVPGAMLCMCKLPFNNVAPGDDGLERCVHCGCH